MKSFKCLFVFLIFSLWLPTAWAQPQLTAPKLTNNPSLDVIATNSRPVLSFFNAKGGKEPRSYTIELSLDPSFSGPELVVYKNVLEQSPFVTAKRVEPKDQLKDKSRYYFRVRAQDATGQLGPWATTRFFVDTKSDDHFMNLSRVQVKRIAASSGYNPQNVCDLDDPGQSSFWQAAPFNNKEAQWIEFDLGDPQEVSRAWILSNPLGKNGWLTEFSLQFSNDGKIWQTIAGTHIKENNTFRNIVSFQPTKARFFRILINKWQGYGAQINALCLYSPYNPAIPKAPDHDYVLIVGDQMNGYTFTQLPRRVQSLNLGLDTLLVPHHKISLDMVRKLKRKPVAIILSGNNAGYQNLPMFEYNGNYELIRECTIPILGICCGHQLTAMAYGLTFANSMGYSDITALNPDPMKRKIKILVKDPVFKGIESPFSAPEIHGWAVTTLPENYQVIAESDYLQALKRNDKMLYGVQFHPEIEAEYNQAMPVLINFLKLAIKQAH